ncbi:hypothetical protein ACFVUS_20380 [Nocardia sp. NPDC058058]
MTAPTAPAPGAPPHPVAAQVLKAWARWGHLPDLQPPPPKPWIGGGRP